MWNGHRKEAWDRVAILRQTMMVTGLSQPKKMPTLAELNPCRQDEIEWDDFESFDRDMEKALR